MVLLPGTIMNEKSVKILYHIVEKESEKKKDSKVSDAYFCMFLRAPQ